MRIGQKKSIGINERGFNEFQYVPRSKKTHVYISDWGRTKYGGGKMPEGTLNLILECELSINKRIRENYNKTIEFKYGSWEDDTKINNYNCNSNIIKVEYYINIDYSPQAKKEVEEIENQFEYEMKDICDTIDTHRKIECPNAERYDRLCYLNEEQKNKSISGSKINFIIWFISYFFGFTSLTDLLYFKEENSIRIPFIKKVSGKNEKNLQSKL